MDRFSVGESGIFDEAYLKDFLNRLKHEGDRVTPDKRGCEVMFSRSFVRGDMYWEFPLIARDFLKHEAANMERYKDLSYGEDRPGYSSLKESWTHTIVHAMYMGVKSGSQYCRELFKYLFRTYYSSLYKSFKRFQRFSMDEVLALADTRNSGHFEPSMIAVILCMAEVFELKLDKSCDVLFYFEEERAKRIVSVCEVGYFEFEDGAFEESRKQVKELFPVDIHTLFQRKARSERFTMKALEYCGYPEAFITYSKDNPEEVELDIARTLAILRTVYPNKEFTAQEVLLYSNLFDVIVAFTETADVCYDALIDVLGLGDDAFYIEEGVLFEPEKIIVRERAVTKEKVQPIKETIPIGEKAEDSYPQELLLKELDKLRGKLHAQEEESRHLRLKLQEAKRQIAEQSVICGEVERTRQELAALRTHLYHVTEYDEAVEEADREDVVRRLGKKKITIIGGHTNWVRKLKKLFPDWDFISPEVSASNMGQDIHLAEYVYFFTDTLSHSVYETYIQLVREKHISFGYIHGVNIEANLKQMREEVLK